MNWQALGVLVDLIEKGYAGLDQYDDTRFVVSGPEPFLTDGENALDDVGAYLLATAPLGVTPSYHAAFLPGRVFMALGLDVAVPPRVEVPLASRRVVFHARSVA